MNEKLTSSTPNNRVQIIQTVQTPLGFFVLVVLVAEVIFGILAGLSAGTDRTYLIWGMFILIFLLVIVVSGLAIFRPEALQGIRPLSQVNLSDKPISISSNDDFTFPKQLNDKADPSLRLTIQDLITHAKNNTLDSQPLNDLGIIYRDQLQDYGYAIWWFMEAIRRRPIASYSYDRIAEIFAKLDDSDSAILWFTRSALADPSNYWPCDRLGELYRDKKGDFNQALKWFTESVSRKPQNSWPHDRIAEIYRDHFDDKQSAIKWFEKSILAEPNNPWPKERLRELQNLFK